MGYVVMTTHLQRSNDGLDYKRLEQHTVTMDRRLLAIMFEKLKPSHGRTQRVRRALATTFGHQRSQTIPSLSPSSSSEAASSFRSCIFTFDRSIAPPICVLTTVQQGVHGNAVPVVRCMLTVLWRSNYAKT